MAFSSVAKQCKHMVIHTPLVSGLIKLHFLSLKRRILLSSDISLTVTILFPNVFT